MQTQMQRQAAMFVQMLNSTCVCSKGIDWSRIVVAAASNNTVDSKRKADTWKRNRRALVSESRCSFLFHATHYKKQISQALFYRHHKHLGSISFLAQNLRIKFAIT